MTPNIVLGADIRYVTKDDIEPVCRLLDASFNEPVSFWRGMLQYPWLAADEKPYYGAMLTIGGEVTGFVGVLFSNRSIDGRTERLANLFGWCVRPEHRRFSLDLLTHLLSEDVTWTNVTCRNDLVPLFLRLGFDSADQIKTICTPQPRTLMSFRSPRVRVLPEREVTIDVLGPAIYAIYCDHFIHTVRRTVFECQGETCLVVTRRRRLARQSIYRGYPVAELYYASNADFFARHYGQMMIKLLRIHRASALSVEPRLMSFVPQGAGSVPAYPLPLFKSGTVPRVKVDSLYTELLLLS